MGATDEVKSQHVATIRLIGLACGCMSSSRELLLIAIALEVFPFYHLHSFHSEPNKNVNILKWLNKYITMCLIMRYVMLK